MVTETLTQKWLRQNIQLYVDRDTVYAHVDASLVRYPSIRPKTDVYTYDDGRTQLLLCLHGLLPIAYRGATYNIPVAVWIPREYPRQPPISYVVPTSDMLIRASTNMDVSGRCRIEYVQNWERKSEGCNLIALMEAMQEHFSREPPVYAKPKTAPIQPQTPARRLDTIGLDYSTRPPPSFPGMSTPNQPSHSVSPTRNDDRPPIPAKPEITQPYTDIRTQSPPNHGPAAPMTTRPPPPLPPHPPVDHSLPQYRQSPVPPRYAVHDHVSSINTNIVAGHPMVAVSTNGPTPNLSGIVSPTGSVGTTPNTTGFVSTSQTMRYGSPVQASPIRTGPSGTVGSVYAPTRPPPPLPPSTSSPPRIPQPQPKPPPLPPTTLSPQITGSVTPQTNSTSHPPSFVYPHAFPPIQSPPPGSMPPSLPQPHIPPPDLLDTEDDSIQLATTALPVLAPPRPPNPELIRLHNEVHAKLSSEFASLERAMGLDAERLRANQANLLAGEPAIRDETGRLEAVRDVCRGVSARLRKVVEDAERQMGDMKRKGDPDVDELVCSTTIVHNQLINLVAEDNAIEDTIYHLHRALNAGRIDLERFLRVTRALAEEQFMKRGLIEKILNGLPIGSTAPSLRPEWS